MITNSVPILHTTHMNVVYVFFSFSCVLSQMRPGRCGVDGALGQSHPCCASEGEEARLYTCTHPPQSTPPTHLYVLLQVLGGCTEAVEGEVLHNRVYRPTHLGRTPYKVTYSTLAGCEHTVLAIRSGRYVVARIVGISLVHTRTTCIHTCARTHTHLYVVWLTRASITNVRCTCWRGGMLH